jgi:uncharacterized protein
MTEEKYLVVSFHDVAPFSRDAYQRFADRLEGMGVHTASVLAVPQWHGEQPIREDASFVAWLRELTQRGYEICLHGHTHRAERVSGGMISQLTGRFYTNREGEYYQISFAEADRLVQTDLAMFREFDIPVCGFVPPAWLLSRDGARALQKHGLLYTTSLQHIELLQEGRSLYAPTLVASSRSAWRRVVSGWWLGFWSRMNRNTDILRVALHPIDLAYPRMEERMAAFIAQAMKSRRVVSYRDLVQEIHLHS